MSKYNLEKGIQESFNILINPGILPLGTASEAQNHSVKTHRLPVPPNIEGEKDYAVIFNKIWTFLDGTDGKKKIPPIYVDPGMKDEDIKAAEMTLEKIVREGGGGNNFVFRVYPLEHLLFRLHKKFIEAKNAKQGTSLKPFSSVFMAKDVMGRDEFMYSDIGCNFHRAQDASQYCCLSKVKRWGYLISRLCLNSEVDTMINGCHKPEQAFVSIDDGLQSSLSKDSEWSSDLTNSFKDFHIDSTTSLSRSSSTYDKETDTTCSESAVSIHSFENSVRIAPSTVDASEFDQPISSRSYSHLIRGKLINFCARNS